MNLYFRGNYLNHEGWVLDIKLSKTSSNSKSLVLTISGGSVHAIIPFGFIERTSGHRSQPESATLHNETFVYLMECTDLTEMRSVKVRSS